MGGETDLVDDSTGTRALVIVTVSFALALLCFTARIYTRVFPRYKLNASDFINSVAVFAEIITYSLFAASINIGYGRHASSITPKLHIKIMQLQLAFMMAGPFVSTLARISTVCQLVALAPSAAWKRSLWVMAGFLLACLFTFDLSVFVQCRPVSAIWNTSIQNSHCLRTRARSIINYTQIGVGMITDLAFAIMPMFLIWKLNRSRLERCLVSTLLALGFCATGMGIPAIIHLSALRRSTDPLRDSVIIYMFCRMEEICLLIASSMPFLKAPVEHVLRQLGAPGFRNIPRELASYHPNGLSDSHELSATPRQGLGRPKTESDSSLNAM